MNKDLDMRRYGKDYFSKAQKEAEKKGYAEGDVVTADDITPEVLEDVGVVIKIQKWGLSDEEIGKLPTITFLELSTLELDEDLRYSAEVVDGNMEMDGVTYPFEDAQHVDDAFRELYNSKYDYIVYNAASAPLVLKLTKYSDNVQADSIDNCLQISYIDQELMVTIGYTSF